MSYKKFKKDYCQVCGATDVKVHGHHANLDRRDNREENICTLCPECHQKLHWFLDRDRKSHFGKRGCLVCGAKIKEYNLCWKHLDRLFMCGDPFYGTVEYFWGANART